MDDAANRSTPRFTGLTTVSPDEFREALRVLSYGSTRMALTLGVDDSAVRRWIRGDRAIPEIVARVVRLIIAGEIDPASLIGAKS
jgi:DNA-binding transcriptional regulator YdaS (Cro superfamily)